MLAEASGAVRLDGTSMRQAINAVKAGGWAELEGDQCQM